MADTKVLDLAPLEKRSLRDVGFAIGIIGILAILFVPVPAFLIDFGLALSIAFSVLILMVALWIQKPLEFSAFPIVLLITTILRLSLGIATARLILARGDQGVYAAGHVIQGFSRFVMSGDFVIGIVVFLILVTVNFVVITKGATRIAEVGARFTLDAIPGKQMAIDADLSAGLIDDKEAQRRRRELEEESAFFGSMDGASKFVRGEAIASLIIIAVNIFGGIIIGTTRHGMPLSQAADVFTRLSVGDGLVSQIPALIVSLAAGLLVSKGGTRGPAERAVLGQLSAYPRALFVAAILMFLLALLPGLPTLPFGTLGVVLSLVSYTIPRRIEARRAAEAAKVRATEAKARDEARNSIKEALKTDEIEISVGKQLAGQVLRSPVELGNRVGKMRRKFALQYGFVVPEIKVSESLTAPAKGYQIKIHGTVIASQEMRIGEYLVVTGESRKPDVPGEEVREPAFGMKAIWIPEAYGAEVRREGFTPVDNLSVMLTHVSEAIRNNLTQLLSYKDTRTLLERLEPEYKRLLEEICPAHISYSGLQAVLKALLAERVSIRNLQQILEAIAEIVPHARRSEQIAEHVRMRIAQQICGDLAESGVLSVLRLGNRWDLAFHQSLKRDAKGEVIEFDVDPRLVEQFAAEASDIIKKKMAEVRNFALVTAPDARPYLRMIIERMFPSLPVLSHVEIARGVEIRSLGTIFVTFFAPETILSAFLIFCRIGACLMVAPGFSSAEIPTRVRLFAALAISLAVTPLLLDAMRLKVGDGAPVTIVPLLASELATGLLIGFIARLFFMALQTISVAITQAIGLGGIPGTMVEDNEQLPALSTLFTMTATALMFATGLHIVLIRGLIDSYGSIPPGHLFVPRLAVVEIADQLRAAFLVALRIGSPFLIYSIIINFAIGVTNKLTPQIPVFFIATPFVMAGGLLLIFVTVKEFMDYFAAAFAAWLAQG